MGNINNIWYIKDGGGSWCDTKCQLDKPYSIPFSVEDNEIYLQVDIPEGYTASEIYLCRMDGTRVQELLYISDKKIINYEDYTRIIFKFPSEESYACNGEPCERCTVSLYQDNDDPVPDTTIWVDNYVAGTNNVTVTIIDLVNAINYDVTNINAPVPPGWERINLTTFYAPCDTDSGDWNLQFTSTGPFGNYTFTWPEVVTEVSVPGCIPLTCFYLEVPLLVDSVEELTLASEPFECVNSCTPTVLIKGDYCLSPTDVFGELLFDFSGQGESVSGSLCKAEFNWRIQAALKQMPPAMVFSRNQRCNTFKTSVTKRYKLQGAVDFPDYMVNIISSLFAAKNVYIDGVKYQPVSENIFSERNVNGLKALRLETELQQCEQKVVFDCSCIPPVVDCETNPIVYDGGMFITPAANVNGGVFTLGSTLDHTYYWAEIDPSQLSGGYPPYTISTWNEGNGKVTPNSDLEVFDDAREFNIFRRNPGTLEEDDGGLTITVKVTDSQGCEINIGVSVGLPDMRCVGFGGTYTYNNITSGTFDITSITTQFGLNAFDCFDLSIDSGTTGFQYIGITTLPYTVTGLGPDTEYQVLLRVWCDCPPDPENPTTEESGLIGPAYITTLP